MMINFGKSDSVNSVVN